MTGAHEQNVTHRYVMRYPAHEPREHDPHYKAFHAYREHHIDKAECAFGAERGDFSQCSLNDPLELHHSVIEYSLINAVTDGYRDAEEWAWFHADYPGIENPDDLDEWVNSSPANLIFLCSYHHRGANGIHTASAADYQASQYIANLIAPIAKD